MRLTYKELKALRIKLVKKQNNKCKICGSLLDLVNNSKNVHVDHCHKTGFVRAVLCRRCNSFEGKVNKLYERLTKRELKSFSDKVKLYKGLVTYLSITPTRFIYPSHGVKRRRKK